MTVTCSSSCTIYVYILGLYTAINPRCQPFAITLFCMCGAGGLTASDSHDLPQHHRKIVYLTAELSKKTFLHAATHKLGNIC